MQQLLRFNQLTFQAIRWNCPWHRNSFRPCYFPYKLQEKLNVDTVEKRTETRGGRLMLMRRILREQKFLGYVTKPADSNKISYPFVTSWILFFVEVGAGTSSVFAGGLDVFDASVFFLKNLVNVAPAFGVAVFGVSGAFRTGDFSSSFPFSFSGATVDFRFFFFSSINMGDAHTGTISVMISPHCDIFIRTKLQYPSRDEITRTPPSLLNEASVRAFK